MGLRGPGAPRADEIKRVLETCVVVSVFLKFGLEEKKSLYIS